MNTVIAERVLHDSGIRVALRFPYDRDLVEIVKELPDARWSNRLRCWHVAEVENLELILLEKLSRYAFVDYSALRRKDMAERIRDIRNENLRRRIVRSQSLPSPYEKDTGGKPEDTSESIPTSGPAAVPLTPSKTIPKSLPGAPPDNGSARTPGTDGEIPAPAAGVWRRLSQQAEYDLMRYREWLGSHRYPPTTVRTYTSMMETFLKFVAPREASECDANDLVRMVNEYILPRGLSYSYQNQLISAVKKFYREICREKIDPGTFTRPRSRHKLPNVLSKEEVKRILEALVNEKHRVMLSLVYGCGLTSQ